MLRLKAELGDRGGPVVERIAGEWARVFAAIAVIVVSIPGCGRPPDARSGLRTSEQRGKEAGWSPGVVRFAGRDWQTRASAVRYGPGPNCWHGNPEAVSVGDNGVLHLRMIRGVGPWCGVEVRTPWPGGYGRVSATIEGPLGDLDPNVVIGFFLYRDDSSEIDVEFSRWGTWDDVSAQFVVAPASPARRQRFSLAPDVERARSVISWSPSTIDFELDTGGQVKRWTYDGDSRPTPAGHYLHVNLWLYRGRAPVTAQSTEITVRDLRIVQAKP